jgi:tyrosyl-tRNA synthetase
MNLKITCPKCKVLSNYLLENEIVTSAFSNKEIPDNIETFNVSKGSKLGTLLMDYKIVSSMGDFKRLISEKAVKINGTEEVTDFGFTIEEDVVFKVGKKRFVAFKVK